MLNDVTPATLARATTTTPPRLSDGTVSLPLDTPTSVFFTDESGAKGTGGRFFVVGGIKLREPGHVLREVKAIRDQHRFFDELKFSDINRGSVEVYRDIIGALWRSDARIVAFVIDKTQRDPFSDVPHWQAHAKVTAQLLHGNINRAEVATALMDQCSTPRGISIDEIVRRQVNEPLGSANLISAVCLDSKSSDGLQLADLVASAVSFDRRQGNTNSASPKAIVARTLASQFGLRDFKDVRNQRVNILTSRPRRAKN